MHGEAIARHDQTERSRGAHRDRWRRWRSRCLRAAAQAAAGRRSARDRRDRHRREGRTAERRQRRAAKSSSRPGIGIRCGCQASHSARVDGRHPDHRQRRQHPLARIGRRRASVDYEITAPAWLPVKVERPVHLHRHRRRAERGVRRTVRGDIVVKGGIGVRDREVDRGRGHRRGREGPHHREFGQRRHPDHRRERRHHRGNDQRRHHAQQSRCEESWTSATVNGDITYEGTSSPAAATASPRTTATSRMIVPETHDATFTVRTYNGDFSSNLPTKAVGEVRRGRRATYTLGNGGAEVELEASAVRFVCAVRVRGRRRDTTRARTSRTDQSARRAAMGFTCAARTAGVADAATAVRVSSAATVRECQRIVGPHLKQHAGDRLTHDQRDTLPILTPLTARQARVQRPSRRPRAGGRRAPCGSRFRACADRRGMPALRKSPSSPPMPNARVPTATAVNAPCLPREGSTNRRSSSMVREHQEAHLQEC